MAGAGDDFGWGREREGRRHHLTRAGWQLSPQRSFFSSARKFSDTDAGNTIAAANSTPSLRLAESLYSSSAVAANGMLRIVQPLHDALR